MPYSATLFTTNTLNKLVFQIGHGFIVGQVLRFNGATFVTAQADNEPNAEVVGMVYAISDADNFWITQVGFVANLATGPYTPGMLYYLSETVPGQLQTVRPTIVGEVIVPCFIADTATSGFFFGNVGEVIEPAIPFTWTTLVAGLTMVPNNGYVINGAGSLALKLPAISAVGNILKIMTLGVNGVSVTQDPFQVIHAVDAVTTVGVGGSLQLQPTNAILAGTLTLICIVANTTWRVDSGTGIWNTI